jgi:hypothetical protein
MQTLSCVVTYSIKSSKKYNVVNDFETSKLKSTPTFQIIRRFGFSRYIAFVMHLIYTMSRYIVKAMDIEKSKHLIIWNGGVAQI